MARPVIPIKNLGRRLPELGRVKDGVKVAGKGQPKAIDTLRFTSQDPKALEQVAATLGGEVKPYKDPKSTDTHELITPVAECRVILPPDPLGGTPMYEHYTGGGRERWCDGVACEMWRKGPDGPEPYEKPCLCAEAGELTCRPTVHLSVILPFTRMGGTWRWTTHSHNAAVELPGMVEAIQALQSKGLTRGVLRIDSRTQTIAGVTRHFKVPVLGVDATADELASGQATFGGLGAGAPTAAIAPAAVAEIEAGGTPTPRDPHGHEPQVQQVVSPPPEIVTGGGGRAATQEQAAACAPKNATAPSGDTDDDVIDAEIVDDGDPLDLLRAAMAEAKPRWTEGKVMRRAKEIATQEVGTHTIPSDFADLVNYPAVLARLAGELEEEAA